MPNRKTVQNPVDVKYIVHPIYSTPFFSNAAKGIREKLRTVARGKDTGTPELQGIGGRDVRA